MLVRLSESLVLYRQVRSRERMEVYSKLNIPVKFTRIWIQLRGKDLSGGGGKATFRNLGEV